MLKNKTKKIIKRAFRKTGLEVRRVAEAKFFDLSEDKGHPLEAVYAARGKPCLVKVSLSRLVTFGYGAFSLETGGGHPFLKTLEEYKKNPVMSERESSLCRFYELFRPASASELMGLSQPSFSRLNELSALEAPPLWAWESPEEYGSYIKSIHQKEDIEQGARFGAFVGGSQFGPVETRKLAVEYCRLTRLYDSIRAYGFRADRCEPMTGVAMVNGSEWLITVSTGQHRIACMAALGYDSAIIKLQPTKAPAGLMLRSCHRHFPTVLNGFHTEEEALEIFDRLISKKPPRAAHKWLAYCAHGDAVEPVVERNQLSAFPC
ncbi:hypothetical protein F0A17_15035 [Billgrantia pellis]|uniref:Uncharacterized protein n=1 Tax=Billgrantia pellis TaxID=2606936 RepID=A0A7V7KG17_9GAMM|nr:hypothetical protein [Halomonas pellis]KAA0011406.1 hypothetical protein F0A17_15035 [Halomonas pellis]